MNFTTAAVNVEPNKNKNKMKSNRVAPTRVETRGVALETVRWIWDIAVLAGAASSLRTSRPFED